MKTTPNLLKIKGKKLLSILMTTVLSTSMLTMVGSPVLQVSAAERDKQMVGLGTGAIEDPDAVNGAGWSYVYYGNYNGSPVKYRVLSKSSTEFGDDSKPTLLLDCDTVLKTMRYRDNVAGSYNSRKNTNNWANSDIRAWLNGNDFKNNTNCFTKAEVSAIATSNKTERDENDFVLTTYNTYTYERLSNDYIFLLDQAESNRPSYGYSTQDACKKIGATTKWWLRTKEYAGPYENARVLYTREDGRSTYSCYTYTDTWKGDTPPTYSDDIGVSPAFNVDLSSIIFTTCLSETPGEPGAEYKLALKDDNLNIALSGSGLERNDNTITVPYSISGSNKMNATAVTVLLTDKKYQPGKSATDDFELCTLTGGVSGSGSFELPARYADKQCGKDYYAYLLAEDINLDKETDYASDPATTEITIPAPVFYDIKCTVEGNGVASADKNKAVKNEEIKISATADSGWQFKMWQVTSENATVADINSATTTFTMPASHVTVKAVFELIPIPSCTVSFDANGGAGTMYKVMVDKDSEFTLPACTFTAPEGKEFDKWDRGEVSAKIKITSDITLKAVWKDKAVTPTPDGDNDNAAIVDGVGTISADGTTLTDTDGAIYLVADKMTEDKLIKNASIADRTSKGKYKITGLTKKGKKIKGGAVTFIKPYDTGATIVTVPETVKIAGIKFKITEIAPGACKNNTVITKITIGKNVGKIGANAFNGCINLKDIRIKTTKLTKKKVGKNAFKNIHKKAIAKVSAKKQKAYKTILKAKGMKGKNQKVKKL